MNYLSSSSDEEVLDAVAEIERSRLFRPRPNPFDKYTDEELSPMTLRNHSLSAGDQILVTLRFYATVLHNIAINENDTNNFEEVVVDEEVEQEVMQVNNG
ncbi:hypothetical protein ILUMI_24045 [Ignelater luminosus]|uniref:Uncharacterized protein n=1 Tax=Ignelater luminosus TaxID=2038154 RepID=A0A8K0CCQ2_IGNLU|nr:hypothetical protein ILUMI_24045 [Ignelater luminosus]